MKNILSIIIFLFISMSSYSLSYSPEYNLKSYYPYGKEATILGTKISKLKNKYNLKYKNEMDLNETCQKIIKHSKYVKDVDKYDIATIFLLESRFNQYAVHPKSGAKGLGQLYKINKYYKDELFWVNNIYDKDQNTIGTIIILKDKIKTFKTKRNGIKRYNGKDCEESRRYVKQFYKIKNEIMRG